MEEFRYRKLKVYGKAQEWVILVYGLLKGFPKEEQYALCDQIRRATVSVTANIAEGYGRGTDKDKAHFLSISYGSLMETQSHLEIAQLLNYINQDELNAITERTAEIARMLSGLRAKITAPGSSL